MSLVLCAGLFHNYSLSVLTAQANGGMLYRPLALGCEYANISTLKYSLTHSLTQVIPFRASHERILFIYIFLFFYRTNVRLSEVLSQRHKGCMKQQTHLKATL